MATTRADIPQRLPTYSTGSASPGWWGIALMVMIESAVFAGLIASYFYLFANATVWPPDGISPPKLLLPTVYTVVLTASVLPAWLGDRALANDNLSRYRLWKAIGSLLLVVFLAMKIWEYVHLDYRWDDNAYTSIVWTIAGFHGAHVLVVLLKAIVQQVLGWKGFFNGRRRSAVQGTTLYWLFVVVVWLALYPTVYLFPNFAQTL